MDARPWLAVCTADVFSQSVGERGRERDKERERERERKRERVREREA